MLVARSRGGRGRHVFLLLPAPASLEDGALAVAALAADALIVATDDQRQTDRPHAFARLDGAIAEPGQPGAMELIPRSSVRPVLGWALALPSAGRYAAAGGGVIIDPFTDEPTTLQRVPRCDAAAWRRFLDEARARIPRPARQKTRPRVCARASAKPGLRSRTNDFLAGRVGAGRRNDEAFAAACDLIAAGVGEDEARRLIIHGADACGLPEREARSAFASALRSTPCK
jgi:hypothetical protein